jgi:hypothetical protein
MNTWAQLSTNEKPVSFGRESEIRVSRRSAKPTVAIPQLDMIKVRSIEAARKKRPELALFGYVHNVCYNPFNSGTWFEFSNGDKLWRLIVTCPEAKSVYISYDKFWLPDGGKLFVYSKDKKQAMGAFTSRNNKGTQEQPRGFATGVINGSNVVLEYYQPKDVTTDAVISINSIVRGYVPLSNNYGFNKSGDCHVNVNCDEGYYWKGEQKAVARILMKGVDPENNHDTIAWYCSGSLISTSNPHGEPFLLTANHCLPPNKNAIVYPDDSNRNILDDALFYWNYEVPGCERDTIEPPIYSTTGAIIVSHYDDSADFALLHLTEDPNDLPNYIPYYLGWDINTDSVSPGVCIHHPRGDVKKISTVDAGGGVISTFYKDYILDNYYGNHWKVTWIQTDHGHGTTEPGSSGSPLFNSSHKVLGQLHGGYSSCGDGIHEADWYGKISCSWVGTNDNFHRRDLGHWLDPREEEADGVERVEGTLYVSKYCVLSRNEYIYGNIHVTGTGQLTISSNIETSGICPLTVESGGKLIINGGKLSNANLNLKPGATLQIMNGGIIETQHGFKAPVGVKVEISHGRIL